MDRFREIVGDDPLHWLVIHQLEAYNDFLQTKLVHIIEGFNPIEVYTDWDGKAQEYGRKVVLSFMRPRIAAPSHYEADGRKTPLTPELALARDLTYSGDLMCDMTIAVSTPDSAGVNETVPNVCIGRIPVMVDSCACKRRETVVKASSGTCRYDPGGYFIVGGNERVLVAHDRMAENRIFVFPVNKTVLYSYCAEVRSLVSEAFGVPKLATVRISKRANRFGHIAHVAMHHVSVNVPLFAMMRVLGASTDRQIFGLITKGLSPALAGRVVEYLMGCPGECFAAGIGTEREAFAWLAERTTVSGLPPEHANVPALKARAVREMLQTELLPHVGPAFARKREVLAEMTRRAALVAMGVHQCHDRDSYVNKRIDTTGSLLGNLLRQYYGKLAKEMRKAIGKEILHNDPGDPVRCCNILQAVKSGIVENGLRYGLATGNWGTKQNAKVGVSQILNRMSYCATISHLRRVNTYIDRNSKLVEPRRLHLSQMGFFCPAETPEGASVGIVKNLALGTRITCATDPDLAWYAIKRVLGALVADWAPDAQDAFDPDRYTVLLNYAPVATTTAAREFAEGVRRLKRAGTVHSFTSVVLDAVHAQVRVTCDGGRLVRPLLFVGDGAAPADAPVEYLDPEEVDGTLISYSGADAPYCEVHPVLMLGVIGAMIPFSDHNQSPRNAYQCAMGKQALGISTLRFRDRYDANAIVMNHAQRPLVRNEISRVLGVDELPYGANLIVGVSTALGYNQEDSVVVNASAVQRGLLVCTAYHTVADELRKNACSGCQEVLYAPDAGSGGRALYNYDKLTPTGFPAMGTYVDTSDVVIGKYMPKRDGLISDESIALKANERGFVDRIVSPDTVTAYEVANADGYAFCKVRMRERRAPEIGDKLSTRSAQKGTIGMMLAHEDMPVTGDGLVPDLLINPHAFPSRMTVGQFLEGVLGKACCMSAEEVDSTAFSSDGTAAEDAFDMLDRCGFERHGEELMYDPRTGRQQRCTMFVTSTFYQRLKHLVADKIHARGGHGPIVMLTRQPSEGRSRDGGLRLGEMENECLLGNGTILFQHERFVTCSDAFKVHLCAVCGNVPNYNLDEKIHKCTVCKNTTRFVEVVMPYAMKLFAQEIESMGVSIKPVVTVT